MTIRMADRRAGEDLRACEAVGWNPSQLRLVQRSEQAALLAAVPQEITLNASSPSSPVTVSGVRAGYASALSAMLGASWARMVASPFPSNSPSETYPWLRAAPIPRKWEGERSVQELGSDEVVLWNEEYEATIEFKVADFRRDKIGQISQRVIDLATRVAFFPESLMSTLLVANGNAYDGKAFFATNHAVGDSGTINNALVAGDGLAGGANPSTAQQATNIGTMLAQMMGFRDDKGEPIHAGARKFLVMVPAKLYPSSVAAINAAFTSASATNPLSELANIGYEFIPILNARLAAQDQMYLMRADGGIRSLLLQEEGVNPMQLGPESEHAKKTNRVMFGHGWQGAVGYGRFEWALRGTLA